MQFTVSRSSIDAEYRTLASTTVEITWLLSLMCELGIFLPHPPTLWCDDISTTYMSANSMFHVRTKLIEIYFLFCTRQGCV